jgi:hypothetical protein
LSSNKRCSASLMVIRTSFGARRGLEAHADTRKMQKPNQGSEKKRLSPEIGV